MIKLEKVITEAKLKHQHGKLNQFLLGINLNNK